MLAKWHASPVRVVGSGAQRLADYQVFDSSPAANILNRRSHIHPARLVLFRAMSSSGGATPTPTSGDAELDALVRDLSRKVGATDGAWVRENTPSGVPSIHDDFEGALRAAPTLDGASRSPRAAAASAEARAEALIAALDDGGEGADLDPGADAFADAFAGARVVDVTDIQRLADEGAAIVGADGEAVPVAQLQSAADDIVAMMLAYEEKNQTIGVGTTVGDGDGDGDGDGATGDGNGDDARAVAEAGIGAALEGTGLTLGGIEGSREGGDEELKAMMKKLSMELREEKAAGKRG